MNADKIVRALKLIARNCDGSHSCWHSPTLKKAVDLIESMQAQLTKYDEVAAEYGIDGKTMLTLAKSQIKTAQDNIKLQEQLAESQRKTQDARNELCQQCGRYREAHNGACNGCRWKE